MVLALRHSNQGQWLCKMQSANFRWLLCSQASPQLVTMLEHTVKRRRRCGA
jgi:hypothetical protein